MKEQRFQDQRVKQFNEEAVPVIIEHFNPQQILVFGSRAKNSQNEESDLDVIIISEKFKEIPFTKRYGRLFSLIKFPVHIDYICYTPEEFESIKNRSIVIDDALSGPVIALV